MATQEEIIRAVVSYSHPAGSICQNVFTWELQDEDTADGVILTALDDWVEVDWGDLWAQVADSNALIYLTEVDVLNLDGTVKRNIGETLTVQAGQIVGEVLPAAVSGFFQGGTERPKSFLRKYVPAISETGSVEGILSAAYLGVLVQLLAEATTDVPVGVIGLLVPGVLSRVTSTFQEATGGGYATDVPAYQRRRKPGVGS